MSSADHNTSDYRIRYGECDMQGVVFNANYMVYVDDAVDSWFRNSIGGDYEAAGFEMMVKKSEITWASSAKFGDTMTLTCRVERVGNTSMVIAVDGTVGDRDVFTALMTYVMVDPAHYRPMPVPETVVAALS
jgi:acyl-CoA thioester hydrolase